MADMDTRGTWRSLGKRPALVAATHADRGTFAFQMGPRPVARDEVIAFATAFDPQPAHLDEDAARTTPLRGLAASGWHTCALIAHDLGNALRARGDYLGMMGIDQLRWLRPVRPGDELFVEVNWSEPEPCACSPTLRRRLAQVEARNQLREVVVRWTCHMLFGQSNCEGIPRSPVSQCNVLGTPPRKVATRRGEHFIKYFEDVCCGDEAVLGSYAFDHPNVALFENLLAGKSDHLDKSHVGGWNVLAAWMSLIVAYYARQAERLAAAGAPVPKLGPASGLRWLRWLAPVSVGDNVIFRSWIERKLDVACGSRWGLVVAGAEGRTACGELAVSFYPQFLLERRPLGSRRGSDLIASEHA